MTYGNSERLSPEEARSFIDDLTHTMSERAWRHVRSLDKQNVDHDYERTEDGPSLQKQMYGDKWTFLYGIGHGVKLMKEGSESVWSDDRTLVSWEVDDGKWQEHYDEYGYGEYGRGLEIGKKLAFYSDADFELSAESPSESENESSFELTDYSSDLPAATRETETFK